MNATTRQNINDRGHLSGQHYLIRYNGDYTIGFFPWNGKVIEVRFDGSRPDSLENIKENSCCELLTVETARARWENYIKCGYTAAAPTEWGKMMNRGVVYGLALKFRKAEESKMFMGKINMKKLNRVYKPIAYPHPYDNTQYALEA